MEEFNLLQKKFAFIEGVVRYKNDLKRKINLPYNNVEDDRIDHKTWWANGFKGIFKNDNNSDWYTVLLDGEKVTTVCRANELFQLKDIILAFGGRDVCLSTIEDDLDNLLNRGQLWIKKKGRVVKIKGQPNQCHRNSSELWYNNKDDFDIHICTGYALDNKDGLWRPHSWLVYIDKDNKPKIIETTVDWSAYYGYVMTQEESLNFYYDNF